MDQVHTPPEGRKKQGLHQHMFPQTWIKFTHQLRAGKHKDYISTSFHRHGSSSHTNWGQKDTRTASAHVYTDMDKVHIPPECRNHKDSISTSLHTHGSSSH